MEIKDRVLIVEDDKNIRKFIQTILEANDYDVIATETGKEAYSLITSRCPDVVILDLGLPDMDGMKILKEVRAWSNMPIIVVSARDHEKDKVEALDMGADDYITKPFNPIELQARVKSQLRRYMQLGGGKTQSDVYSVGGIVLNPITKEVTLDSDPIALTRIEYNILLFLMQHVGQSFTPREIYQNVWHDNAYGEESTVAVHIRHLREKIEYNPAEPRYLKAVWGRGYKLDNN